MKKLSITFDQYKRMTNEKTFTLPKARIVVQELKERKDTDLFCFYTDTGYLYVLDREFNIVHEEEPSLPQKAVTLAKAVHETASNMVRGKKALNTIAEYKRRIKICRGCEKYVDSRCKLCGCFMGFKNIFNTAKCPHPDGDRWELKGDT